MRKSVWQEMSDSGCLYLDSMIDEEVQDRVQQKVKARKGFLGHLGVYVAVGIFFLVINILTMGPGGSLWFYWPMVPWGMGLLIHYFAVFGLPGTHELVEKWELEETARELKRMRSSEEKMLKSGVPDDGLELRNLDPETQKSRYDDQDFV